MSAPVQALRQDLKRTPGRPRRTIDAVVDDVTIDLGEEVHVLEEEKGAMARAGAAPLLQTPPPRRSLRVASRSATPEPVTAAAAAAVAASGKKSAGAKRKLKQEEDEDVQGEGEGASAPCAPPEEDAGAGAGPGAGAAKKPRAAPASRKKKTLFEAPAEFPTYLPQVYKDLSGRWDLKVVPLEPARQAELRGIVAELELDIAPETLNQILYCRAATAAPAKLLPASVRALPRLGFACLNMNLRHYHPPVYTNRSCILKTFETKGIGHAAALFLENVKDLAPLFLWNEVNGISFMRLSSDMAPFWGMKYRTLSELPNYAEVKAVLAKAGALARRLGHRITAHPSHFTKLASQDAGTIERSILDLELHSEVFDLMGFLPASVENKLNIHVGGAYADKPATLARFNESVRRLSPNARARLTVENDDRPNLFSVKELYEGVYKATGVPIVYDLHHHRIHPDGLSHGEALALAASTWPKDVAPVVHWSEGKPDPARPDSDKLRPAHSDYVFELLDLTLPATGAGQRPVEVMVEAKAKECAVLRFKQMVMEGAVAPNEHDEVLRRRGAGEGAELEGEDGDPDYEPAAAGPGAGAPRPP